MSGKRASIFEAESELDVSGFAPKDVVTPKVQPEQVRAVSEAANFQSREPPREILTDSRKREPRRYRTGRNIQLNIKARAEVIDDFLRELPTGRAGYSVRRSSVQLPRLSENSRPPYRICHC